MATSKIKTSVISLHLGDITPTTANDFQNLFEKVFDRLPIDENVMVGTFFYAGLWIFMGTKYQSGSNYYGCMMLQKSMATSIYAASVNSNTLTYSQK